MLGYEYLKNDYRLTALDLSRQKKLDTDPKEIQQIKFVGITSVDLQWNYLNQITSWITLNNKTKANIRYDFAINMLMDIKLSEAQISKIIELGGFLGSWFVKLGTICSTDLAVSLKIICLN